VFKLYITCRCILILKAFSQCIFAAMNGWMMRNVKGGGDSGVCVWIWL
jgi:hypothetical protein